MSRSLPLQPSFDCETLFRPIHLTHTLKTLVLSVFVPIQGTFVPIELPFVPIELSGVPIEIRIVPIEFPLVAIDGELG
jgi:hypothetical protein